MDSIFTFSEQVQPFRLFSAQHMAAIGVLIVIYALIYFFRERLGNEKIDKVMRYSIAAALYLQEISLHLWRLSNGTWSAGSTLPFHLCGLMVVLCPIMLVTRSYRIYELIYLIGMAGATQALLTPDIGIYGFPHYRFYQFFTSHGLIVLSLLYMTFVHRFSPKLESIKKSFIALNILLPVIGVLNYITGGNYFFIARKPDTASLLDFLGPWPWYIISLEGLALVFMFIFYLPFAANNLINRLRERSGRDTGIPL